MEIIIAWFLADILTGIIHWWQDHYLSGASRYTFLRSISADNDLHHIRPSAMTELTIWENINTSTIGLPVASFLFFFGAPNIICLTILFATFGNLVHRYAHVSNEKIPFVIKFLQRTGIFISTDHHFAHHFDDEGLISKENTTIRFCPMTNWMNPILDFIKFFTILEGILNLFGVYRTWRTNDK